MKKYLFLGDTHGDIDFAERAMRFARDNDCAEIIQVGDWGFIWTNTDHTKYLSTLLERYGVTMRFIDGNHDHHPRLQAVDVYCKDEFEEHGRITPWLRYQPRGSVYTDSDGTRFLFCGGAPSIDKAWRVDRITWWAEEEITDEQRDRALAAPGPFDVLVTHDAPQYPPGYGPKGDPAFRRAGDRSMAIIAGLIEKHRPPLHVHGHWHERYERSNGVTTTVGLACNNDRLDDAIMIWSKDQ